MNSTDTVSIVLDSACFFILDFQEIKKELILVNKIKLF